MQLIRKTPCCNCSFCESSDQNELNGSQSVADEHCSGLEPEMPSVRGALPEQFADIFVLHPSTFIVKVPLRIGDIWSVKGCHCIPIGLHDLAFIAFLLCQVDNNDFPEVMADLFVEVLADRGTVLLNSPFQNGYWLQGPG